MLTSGGMEAIDFGIVPEGCSITKEVMVINQSHQSLPVILTLQQVSGFTPDSKENMWPPSGVRIVRHWYQPCIHQHKIYNIQSLH